MPPEHGEAQDWPESICPEYNAQVFIGKDNYDLRYFKQSQRSK
jgi:hypothetical protein